VAEDYSTLSKAIGIHILNFTSIPAVEEYHNVFHFTEKTSRLAYFTDLELHTIELKKFSSNSNEKLSDLIIKVRNSLDMWLAFLTRHDLLKVDSLPDNLNDANLKKAINVLDVMNFSKEEREAYEEHLKWLRVEANTVKKAEARGKAEGKIENAKEIAKAMIKKKMEVELISELTKLSIEEINSFCRKNF
jgi:predicted transposase/invertase (TIGR01784 family)